MRTLILSTLICSYSLSVHAEHKCADRFDKKIVKEENAALKSGLATVLLIPTVIPSIGAAIYSGKNAWDSHVHSKASGLLKAATVYNFQINLRMTPDVKLERLLRNFHKTHKFNFKFETMVRILDDINDNAENCPRSYEHIPELVRKLYRDEIPYSRSSL